MNDPTPEKVALTPAEFAALFGKSQSWGYRQLYSGNVKALTGYGRVLIPVSEVERLLETSGRYLSSRTMAEKVRISQTSKGPKQKNWKQLVADRRSGKRCRKTNSDLQASALRSSALRKLNHSRK